MRAVYEELAAARPAGFRYATFKLPTASRFVHLADHDGAGSPLTGLDAFQAFQRGHPRALRRAAGVSELSEVGSFGW